MSEAGNAVNNQAAAQSNAPDAGANRVAELKVSGHLMTLDSGMFCIFHAPGAPVPDDGSGLPGVRVSLPPAQAGRPEGVRISTFRPDGWLDFGDGAALVRVERGPAQVLVTVYQSPAAAAETAPRLQVLRLTPDGAPVARAGAAAPQAPAPAPPSPIARADVVAHVQRTGDVAGAFGNWVGTRGSGNWIEGFVINPPSGLAAEELEYQAVLGRGWLSPWIEGGKFCGSRGMALPLLGLNVRLKGDAAKTYECNYHASFVDGSSVGPVPAGEACQSDSLAALESFQVVLRRRGVASTAAPSPAPTTPRPVPWPAPAKRAAAPAKHPAPPAKPAAAKRMASPAKAAAAKRTAAKPAPKAPAAKTAAAKRAALHDRQRPPGRRPR